MLVTEGGHLAHLKIFGNEIVPMSKTTFYFVIAILVVTDIVQGRYQKKLIAEREANIEFGKQIRREKRLKKAIKLWMSVYLSRTPIFSFVAQSFDLGKPF